VGLFTSRRQIIRSTANLLRTQRDEPVHIGDVQRTGHGGVAAKRMAA
jgi:hypothetical protein